MKRFLLISLATAFLTSACGAAAAPEMIFDQAMEVEAPMAAGDFVPDEASASSGSAGFEAAAVKRLVIQNANLSIVVPDPVSKMEEIGKMASSMGGFVVSQESYQTFTSNNVKVPEGNITIRIPAENLDEALEQIKADAVEVQNESRSGEDVTREYIDLKSRRKTHEQAAKQLSEILEGKTESTEVIEVFNQLVFHREQIELLKGQISYFEEAAALSAVSVQITAEETLQPLEIAGWKPVGVARDALQALINFFQSFITFLIWVIILIIPAGLLILGLLWLVRKVFSFAWRKLFPHTKKKIKTPKEKK